MIAPGRGAIVVATFGVGEGLVAGGAGWSIATMASLQDAFSSGNVPGGVARGAGSTTGYRLGSLRDRAPRRPRAFECIAVAAKAKVTGVWRVVGRLVADDR